MFSEEILLVMIVLLLLLLLARVAWLVFKSERKSQRRKNAWLNLGICIAYSVLCWLPILTYEPSYYSDLPSIDIGPALLVIAWAWLFMLHVLVYWLVVELTCYYERKAIGNNTIPLSKNEQP